MEEAAHVGVHSPRVTESPGSSGGTPQGNSIGKVKSRSGLFAREAPRVRRARWLRGVYAISVVFDDGYELLVGVRTASSSDQRITGVDEATLVDPQGRIQVSFRSGVAGSLPTVNGSYDEATLARYVAAATQRAAKHAPRRDRDDVRVAVLHLRSEWHRLACGAPGGEAAPVV
jgi:hypothetical protein